MRRGGGAVAVLLLVTTSPGAFVHEGQLFAPGALARASAGFGSVVSVSGDTTIVGSPFADTLSGTDAGAAYVFMRSGTDWTEPQELVAPDGAPGDFFGISVAIAGDTAVVGARLDDTVAGPNAGSVSVFVRSGTTWTLRQQLFASDGSAGDAFGTSVSLSADTLVVGAPVADTVGGVDAGAVYVFVRTGANWTEQQKIIPSDARTLQDFGYATSLSGDTMVVGAPSDDLGERYNAGSAYVFVRSRGTWAERQKLLARDGAQGDHFGFSVSVSGDTAVAGAFSADAAGMMDTGSAYVFERSGREWGAPHKLLATDAARGDYFGFAVSLAGEIAVVGAPRDDTSAGADRGSAYVFVRSGGTWTEQRKQSAPDASAGDAFGRAVSIAADTAVVGAPADDTPSGTDAGSAHVFRGSVPVELPLVAVE
jgi:hypothetical protein